jgi:hypothetical protein
MPLSCFASFARTVSFSPLSGSLACHLDAIHRGKKPVQKIGSVPSKNTVNPKKADVQKDALTIAAA